MTFPSRPRRHLPSPAHRSAGQGAPWHMPGGVGRWAGRLQTQALVRLALAWLLLALVVVPTLGRLHQVAHGGTLDRVHAEQALAHSAALASSLPLASAATAPGAANAAPLPAASHSHGLWSLFLGQHAPVDCLLLDQLALGDALHSAPAALPDAVPAHAPPADHALRTAAAHVALFQARGPPSA
ncbi:hypothetical protein ACIGHN_26225 [Acidovorax sp. NPDC077693]|uniref:hypothetical protein n=1 Tax=unclassified Acidovorax TaxID=2684926 RepID=UPI0037C84712